MAKVWLIEHLKFSFFSCFCFEQLLLCIGTAKAPFIYLLACLFLIIIFMLLGGQPSLCQNAQLFFFLSNSVHARTFQVCDNEIKLVTELGLFKTQVGKSLLHSHIWRN